MEICFFKREARFHRGVNFSAGDNVCAEPLFCDDFIHFFERRRLACVKRAGIAAEIFFHRVGIGAAVFSYALFVHNIKRRTEFGDEFGGRDARKGQDSVFNADIFANHIFNTP